jgi:hypothetical protein
MVINSTPACDPTIVAKAIDDLLSAQDLATLQLLPPKWRHTLSADEQRELVAQLLGHVRIERILKLVDANRLHEDNPEFKAFVGLDARVEGDRCAWAIGELLFCTMLSGRVLQLSERIPGVQYTESEHNAAFLRLCQRVVRSMAVPAIESLSPAECMRLASSRFADPRLLLELAKSDNADVRLAVAKNGHTDFDTLKTLSNDPNADVRAAAIDNQHHARTISSGGFIP